MNFIFKLFSGGRAILTAESKKEAYKRMSAIYGKDQFELTA